MSAIDGSRAGRTLALLRMLGLALYTLLVERAMIRCIFPSKRLSNTLLIIEGWADEDRCLSQGAPHVPTHVCLASWNYA